MAKSVYPLILLSVAISACAQIALKAGMGSPAVQRALTGGGSRIAALFDVALNPFVILGLALYFGSAAVWLLVLSKVEVSFAYPFVALGFVMTALLGRLLFHDSFSAAKIIGTLLIMAGVVVLARG
ncbi:MAG TPA: EamA family transporter [Sphingomonadaceae bacterium]|nr:EamA family transporter [Sphingomonadaceae bacterium]